MKNLDVILLTITVVGLFTTLIARTFLVFSNTVDKENSKSREPDAKPTPRPPWFSDRETE